MLSMLSIKSMNIVMLEGSIAQSAKPVVVTVCALNRGDPFRSLVPRFNSIAALLAFQLKCK